MTRDSWISTPVHLALGYLSRSQPAREPFPKPISRIVSRPVLSLLESNFLKYSAASYYTFRKDFDPIVSKIRKRYKYFSYLGRSNNCLFVRYLDPTTILVRIMVIKSRPALCRIIIQVMNTLLNLWVLESAPRTRSDYLLASIVRRARHHWYI